MKKADKAYKNEEFLNSSDARGLRILSEYVEPDVRFKKEDIKNTVVFFGSARVKDEEGPNPNYFKAAEEFAYQLGLISNELKGTDKKFALCTGGGPGIMEAGNKGANRAGTRSIGLNIALPFEQHPNDFIDKELNFEFHYFFMRKLWFLYHAKAIVYFPGGFGTLDELFETLTLIQTQKYEKQNIPIFLYDEKFWKKLINWEELVKQGLISPEDLDLLHFFSSVDEGIDLLKPLLLESIKEYKKFI